MADTRPRQMTPEEFFLIHHISSATRASSDMRL
jgi:hypothetical protein